MTGASDPVSSVIAQFVVMDFSFNTADSIRCNISSWPCKARRLSRDVARKHLSAVLGLLIETRVTKNKIIENLHQTVIWSTYMLLLY